MCALMTASCEYVINVIMGIIAFVVRDNSADGKSLSQSFEPLVYSALDNHIMAVVGRAVEPEDTHQH